MLLPVSRRNKTRHWNLVQRKCPNCNNKDYNKTSAIEQLDANLLSQYICMAIFNDQWRKGISIKLMNIVGGELIEHTTSVADYGVYKVQINTADTDLFNQKEHQTNRLTEGANKKSNLSAHILIRSFGPLQTMSSLTSSKLPHKKTA